MKFMNAQHYSFSVRTHISPLQECCPCRISGVVSSSEQVLTAEHTEILSELVPDWMEKSNDSWMLRQLIILSRQCDMEAGNGTVLGGGGIMWLITPANNLQPQHKVEDCSFHSYSTT